MHRRIPRHCVLIGVATLLLAIACSDEDRDTAQSAAEEAVDDVEEAARTAASEVEQALDEAAIDATELAVRNLAAERGEEQFADAGHPIDGGLDCTATVDEPQAIVALECTGTTEDGGAAELTGTTDRVPDITLTALDGEFAGTVDGDEVFTTESLGG